MSNSQFVNHKPYPADEVCNPVWSLLLKIFHSIDPKQEGARDKYTSLKEMSLFKPLTERQHEGIIARCNWQIRLIDNPDEAKKIEDQDKNNMKYGIVPPKKD